MSVVVCLVVTTLRFWFCGGEFLLRFAALNLAAWFRARARSLDFGFIFVVKSDSFYLNKNNINPHEMATFEH
eukprot:COSAG05_NODE_1280_length_5292_cov_3.009436_1_plen_72_part_00